MLIGKRDFALQGHCVLKLERKIALFGTEPLLRPVDSAIEAYDFSSKMLRFEATQYTVLYTVLLSITTSKCAPIKRQRVAFHLLQLHRLGRRLPCL